MILVIQIRVRGGIRIVDLVLDHGQVPVSTLKIIIGQFNAYKGLFEFFICFPGKDYYLPDLDSIPLHYYINGVVE